MDSASSDWAAFSQVFTPLVRALVAQVRASNIVDMAYKPALQALCEMVEIKVPGTKNRPVCQLLTEMEEWLPAEVASSRGGRELPTVSLLGPFLSVSVFPEEDPAVAEAHFNGPISKLNVRPLALQLQQDLEYLRVRDVIALEVTSVLEQRISKGEESETGPFVVKRQRHRD